MDLDIEQDDATRQLRVLRVYHSGVVRLSRQREHELRRAGVDVTLVSARAWNEGGTSVRLDAVEPWIVGCRTIGGHPYRFVYDPIPLLRLLRHGEFDVLDVHEEPASLAAFELRILAWLSGRHRHTPMLMYGAQNIEKRYPIPFRWIEQRSLRRAAAVYPCNDEAGEIFIRKGFRGVVRQLDLGVGMADFGTAGTGGKSCDAADGADHHTAVVIGYVGRLEENKGVQVALAALARLPADHSLVLVGDGPHRPVLRALAERLGVLDRVDFRGHVDQVALRQVYQEFDVVVVPSQTRPHWMEQFGRVAVEAMAAGIPLIVADSGSLPEVVGSAALIVGEDDATQWADQITTLVEDADLRAQLIVAGRQRAADFSWTRIAVQQRDLYELVRRA